MLCLEVYGESLELEDLGEAVMKEMTRQADRGDVYFWVGTQVDATKRGAGVIQFAVFFWGEV